MYWIKNIINFIYKVFCYIFQINKTDKEKEEHNYNESCLIVTTDGYQITDCNGVMLTVKK